MSFFFFFRQPKEHIPIAKILRELGEKIDNLQVCKFNINRSAVLDGAIRGFRQLSYDPNKMMSIKFSDDRGTTEEAVDLSGPRPELLRLLMESLAESDMFEGPKGRLNLALSSSGVYIRIFHNICIKGVIFVVGLHLIYFNSAFDTGACAGVTHQFVFWIVFLRSSFF